MTRAKGKAIQKAKAIADGKVKRPKTVVVQHPYASGCYDHHDVQDFMEDLAKAGYVTKHYDWFVLSDEPMTQSQACKTIRLDQLEWAEKDLQAGDDAMDVYAFRAVSARDIDRLVKKIGLPKLPAGWWDTERAEAIRAGAR
jgi:hypothetical protein